MYILYKNDGSIKKKNLTDYIQRGNNNVNSIFLAIEGKQNTEWSPTCYFKLPDGTSTLLTASLGSQTIDGKNYSGYIIPISANVTILEGIVKFSLQIRNIQEETLATFESELVINPAAAIPNETTITIAQYNAILDYILGKTENYDKIIVLEDITQADLTSYETGQIFLDKETRNFYEKIENEPYYQFFDVVKIYIEANNETTFKEIADYNKPVVVKYNNLYYLFFAFSPSSGFYVFTITDLKDTKQVFTSNNEAVEIQNDTLFSTIISYNNNPYYINYDKYYAADIDGNVDGNILTLQLKAKDGTTILKELTLTLPEGGGGEQPTLFPPVIDTNTTNKATWSKNTNNGSFGTTTTGYIDGDVVTTPLTITPELNGKTLIVTTKGTNFNDGVSSVVLQHVHIADDGDLEVESINENLKASYPYCAVEFGFFLSPGSPGTERLTYFYNQEEIGKICNTHYTNSAFYNSDKFALIPFGNITSGVYQFKCAFVVNQYFITGVNDEIVIYFERSSETPTAQVTATNLESGRPVHPIWSNHLSGNGTIYLYVDGALIKTAEIVNGEAHIVANFGGLLTAGKVITISGTISNF